MMEQREALLRLLDDDDPATLDLVKRQLAQTGADRLADLQQLLRSANPVSARHLRDVICEIEEREADTIFANLCSTFSDDSDLEEALWRLAGTFTPGKDFTPQRELLEQWSAEVARRLLKAQTSLDRVETLSEFLSTEVQLVGNEEDYYNIENSLLPSVIESRQGIPISLSLVYMMVGRRAGLQIDGVGLPGHFLARHREIFFDPFHGGRRIGLDECQALMKQQKMELRPEHLAPARPSQILVRSLANIYYVAERNDPPLAAKVAAWIEALRG